MMASGTDSAAILARFPGPVTLPPSRVKWTLVLILSALFVSGAIWMVTEGERGWWVWSGIVLFGLGMIIAAIQLLLPAAAYLKLDSDGFETAILFRPQRTSWKVASGFEAVRSWHTFMARVLYDDARVPIIRPALPDNYGFRARDLAQIMNAWRERALARR